MFLLCVRMIIDLRFGGGGRGFLGLVLFIRKGVGVVVGVVGGFWCLCGWMWVVFVDVILFRGFDGDLKMCVLGVI